MHTFENVREQLLRAGIPPRHARRYVDELRDHLSDLVEQQHATVLDPRQAEARARELLGSDEQLACAMIDSAPRSLAARAPGVVFAFLPMLLLAVIILGLGLVAFQLLWPVRGVAPSDMPTGYAFFIVTVGFFTNYALGPLLAAGSITMALRQRVRSVWVWVGLALLALFSGPLGFHTRYVPQEAGGDGSTLYSMARFAYEQGSPDLVATMTLALSRSVVMFVVLTVLYLALQSRQSRYRR